MLITVLVLPNRWRLYVYYKRKLPCLEQGSQHILVASVVLAEAVAAIDRTVAAGTERNLSLNTASGAGYVMHFALLEATTTAATEATARVATVLCFASCTAIRATAWLVGEAFLSKEVLLRSGEYELGATVAAG